MMYRVELAAGARRFYANADRSLARKLARCFSQLESDPLRHNCIKSLKGPFAGLYRYRIGDWRVIYRTDHTAKLVYVLDIDHRSNIYE